MLSKLRFSVPAALLVCACMAEPAGAEIVVLKSGSTLAVKAHRTEGSLVVLQLRSGGEMTCDTALIDRIVPDEVPYQEPSPAPAPVPAAAKAVQAVLAAGPYSEIISSMSQAHGLDPMLVNALIQVESNYRPRARSHKGAMGLMQLMPSTARRYNVRNPYDPRANVAAGVKHLKSLMDSFGGAVELALAAYNAGEGAVKKFGGVPPYRETRNYVSRILSLAGH
ncbi:MAG: lytic transglycosylase domain-containing protein [Vicinamibacterales bacterium]